MTDPWRDTPPGTLVRRSPHWYREHPGGAVHKGVPGLSCNSTKAATRQGACLVTTTTVSQPDENGKPVILPGLATGAPGPRDRVLAHPVARSEASSGPRPAWYAGGCRHGFTPSL